MSVRLVVGDALESLRTLDAESVQCCVTSPPYWGLRDYGVEGQLGLEKSPAEYVAAMVAVFAEVRRVLRKDGTLWLNLGDSYSSGGRTTQCAQTVRGQVVDTKRRPKTRTAGSDAASGKHAALNGTAVRPGVVEGLAGKQLLGIPWRVAFALQDAGWWLREDIIWAKKNGMPESVTDRCTRSHEYLFHFAKSARYYHDAAAIAEPCAESTGPRLDRAHSGYEPPGQSAHRGSAVAPRENAKRRLAPPDANGSTLSGGAHGRHVLGDAIPEKERLTDKQRGHSRRRAGFNDRWDAMEKDEQCTGMRNARSVWQIATHPFPEAHFATFPPELPRRCIAAGSRVGDTVLDPFAGAGTTLLVADRLQRHGIGIELNPQYAAMAERRISADAPLFNATAPDAPA